MSYASITTPLSVSQRVNGSFGFNGFGLPPSDFSRWCSKVSSPTSRLTVTPVPVPSEDIPAAAWKIASRASKRRWASVRDIRPGHMLSPWTRTPWSQSANHSEWANASRISFNCTPAVAPPSASRKHSSPTIPTRARRLRCARSADWCAPSGSAAVTQLFSVTR